jgi:hypothetical protein
LFEVPDCDLAHICQLKDQVQIIVTVVVYHLVEFGNVRMVELGPDFDLTVHFVKVVDHLHLASFVVSNRTLTSERWLVHHFHGELSNLFGVENRFKGINFSLRLGFFKSGMVRLELGHSFSSVLKTDHAFDLAVRTPTNVVAD